MRTMHRWPPVVAALFAVVSLCADAAGREAAPAAPAGLLAAIKAIRPDARLLEKSELDEGACGRGRPQPGIVEADFDGNGVKDYATLLVVGDPRKTEKELNGKQWQRFELWLVVFMGQSDGQFKPVTLDKMQGWIPSSRGLRLQKAGSSRLADSRRRVWLRHPGFALYACEQYAVIYYWSGSRFEMVPAAR